ncbi:hypothetical protein As57867_007285, partial [Aphanomyces stellatus]
MEPVREYSVEDILAPDEEVDVVPAILDAGHVDEGRLGSEIEIEEANSGSECDDGSSASEDDISSNSEDERDEAGTHMKAEYMREHSMKVLFEAVVAGRVDDMLAILNAGHVDVNTKGNINDKCREEDKITALAYACKLGRNDAVAFLLTRDNIQVNDRSCWYGKSALLYASENGHAEVVRILLDYGGIDINLVSKSGKSALMYASENGHGKVVRMLLDHDGVDINLVNKFGKSALMYASENGHAEAVRMLLNHGVDINVVNEYGKSALMYATLNGHAKVVLMLLDHGAYINVVDHHSDQSAFMYASENGHAEIVRMLLDHVGVDINFVHKRVSYIIHDVLTVVIIIYLHDHMEIVRLLSVRNDIMCKEDIEFSICQKKYAALATMLEYHGIDRSTNDVSMDGTPLVECCAEYLRHESALNLLFVDFPVAIQDSNLVQRQDYSYSWASFMDVTHPVDVNVRLSCLKSILKDEKFAACSQELLRELAFGKDKHGREVIQITDAATRNYLNDRLFFCGRYEIFEGPPVHVSNTAVVVMAYDHCICAQLFHEHKNTSGDLDEAGFVKCNAIMGRDSKSKGNQKREEEKWQAEFRLWDKDSNGSLSEDEFLRYCAQYCGKKLKVAMKFMKNDDEYKREIENRKGLDDSFVLSLLPSVDFTAFQKNLNTLKIHGGYPMTDYPHVMVMPAADRSLEDIFLKERPGENERRILLQQVAEGLQHLHQHEFIHGDVKKLNVIRVGNRLKLIDLDATTTFGDYVGAKFSSGSLPPELFYKLASTEEIDLHSNYWANVESTNHDLWQKVKPKGSFVVKSFRHEKNKLPYALVKAHPSLDVWAFGALMYQMYSGEELVSTDINQDVLEKEIEEAATWTQENLVKRIRSKIISNAQVCDLLEKLLVVNPKNRPSMAAVLD